MTSSLGCLSPSGLARNLSEHPVNVNRRSLAFVVVGPLLRLLGCYGGTDLTLRRTSTEGNLLSRSLPSVLGSLPFVWLSLLFLFCAFPALVRAQQPDEQSRANIAGTVVDPKGTPVVGAQVKLTRQDQSRDPSSGQETLTGDDGQFSIPAIAPGPFQLTVTAAGFATETTSGAVRPGESFVVPQITLRLATEVTEVQVVLSPIEIAEEQMKEQEKQRVLGIIPNFYVSYIPDALPLTSKQKFKLAFRTSVDPVTFGVTAAVAGVEQATDEFNGFGQGAQGYAKRYGTAYADTVISTFIGGAILPSLLKQDPRYFYKGTGTKRQRALYAMANAVICKGDNGHWQPNYSGILGGFASGAISTLYYPPEHNETDLIVENTLIGIGATAAVNLLQEFVLRKLTPNLPKHNPPAQAPAGN